MHDKDFMSPEEHYAALVDMLPAATRAVYAQTLNARIETAFRNRQFVVYEIHRREPRQLDRLTVSDFVCDDADGASCEVRNKEGRTAVVGYQPTQMFGYPIFFSIPLHAKLRWSAQPGDPLKGSLGFPLLVRTVSRLDPRERGVIHCETGPAYGKEFDSAVA